VVPNIQVWNVKHMYICWWWLPSWKHSVT